MIRMQWYSWLPVVGMLVIILAGLVPGAAAHGVDEDDREFLEGARGVHFLTFVWLGAKHMITGVDHLLFLAGVVFFLYRPRDVLLYVSLFTIGHSLTLLVGVLGGLRADPYLVDAVIGVSVVYKAFDNMGGFRRILGRSLDSRGPVFVFGLFHGFGLATKLQDVRLASEGLVWNILSFNLGVEVGQVVALVFILGFLALWRRLPGFDVQAFHANTLIMSGGFMLVGYQLTGYFAGGA